MTLIDVEDWGTHELMAHPTRLDANVDSFEKEERIYRTRALLGSERRFFNNKIENTFAESCTEVTMK